ncbi:HlyD family type I secretion periplasmic adaptor subunit [Parvibium lacunae]|uniref:Membrane fusion protein (MFP) family protein n=1 Tax=Parvibium lacunae TaxID=1888893 RepID=A0A368L204_9BURK|nr:HlyD family type I secretion periplasmic adaptor subunit [Parvibium lacunae]RCS57585.1 HlyD family type I secretion periplasmic adaptor subunit [Parvibium lacunae]
MSKMYLMAWVDLFKRYGQIFRAVWQQRSSLDSPVRLSHETAFLPAALALQETPPSPFPRLTLWILLCFSSLLLLWACFGQIDVVATAQGKIVLNDRSKTIQPLESAVVRAIHVRDGQFVQAGQILLELDATMTTADRERIQQDWQVAKLQVLRSQALIQALSIGQLPSLSKPAGISGLRYAEAQRQVQGQYGEYQAKLNRLEADIHRRQAEVRSTQELIRKLEQTVPIVRQRAQDYQRLMAENYVSQHGFLEKEQIRIEQEADLATQRSRLQEIEAALREAIGQKDLMVAETRRITLDSLTEGQQKVTTLEQELLKATSRQELMRITAPVTGTVQQLAIHTIGGVVTPAQALMVIVPSGDTLDIEAFLENKDIGFVKPGQAAEIKIETFPYTKYGTISGVINTVSHDAINDEKRGLIYATRVGMARHVVMVGGAAVKLSPGMAVSVEIKTGKRRVIEYFLTPLLEVRHESLRER